MPAPESPYMDDVIKVVDISDDLPKHAHKRYRVIEHRPIGKLIWHHTAGGISPGLRGPVSMTRWCIDGRGWPGAPYHIWISYRPDVDAEGRIIVWQLQPLDVRSYHTGAGQNGHGIGAVCQGLFVSPHHPKTLKRQPTKHPSAEQQRAIPHVWKWISDLYGLEADPGLSCHAWHRKPACPGEWIEDWCRAKRGGA